MLHFIIKIVLGVGSILGIFLMPLIVDASDYTSNLDHLWKMDETSGNVVDSAGSLNSTTNTSVTFAAGKSNNAATFGSGSSLAFSNTTLINGTSDFTLAFWVKYVSGVWIMSRRDSFPAQWQLVQNGGCLYFDNGSANVFQGSCFALSNDSAWHHIAIVRSGSSWTLYVDGSSVATDSSSASIATGHQFNIGSPNDGSGSFVGSLDDVRVYSRALTSGDISALYSSYTTSSPPPVFSINNPVYFNATTTCTQWATSTPAAVGSTTYATVGTSSCVSLIPIFGSASTSILYTNSPSYGDWIFLSSLILFCVAFIPVGTAYSLIGVSNKRQK